MSDAGALARVKLIDVVPMSPAAVALALWAESLGQLTALAILWRFGLKKRRRNDLLKLDLSLKFQPS